MAAMAASVASMSSSSVGSDVSGGEVRIRLFTRQIRNTVTDEPIVVPASVRRSHLSQMVNMLLGRSDKSVTTPFDFLVGSEFLRASLSKHLSERGISTETVIDVEYVEAMAPPDPPTTLPHDDWVSSVDGTPDGLLVSGSYDSAVRLWTGNIAPTATLTGHQDAVRSVCVVPESSSSSSSDGESASALALGRSSVVRVASASQDETVRLWTLDSTTPSSSPSNLAVIDCLVCLGHTGAVDCVVAQPTGHMLASGSWDRTVRLWSTNPDPEDVTVTPLLNPAPKRRRRQQARAKKERTVSRPLVTLSGSTGAVHAVSWPTLDVLYSGGEDHCVRVWDVTMGTITRTMTGSQVISDLAVSTADAAVASQQLVASAEFDGRVRIYDPRAQGGGGALILQTLASHRRPASSVAWSPDNAQNLVSGSLDAAGDNVKLWDIRSPGVPLHNLEGHEGKVLAVAWTSQQSIATGGSDGRLSLHTLPEEAAVEQ